MKLPRIRYTFVRKRYLELDSFDGTRRGVVFSSDAAADGALSPGRAEIDVTAIENGFLPRGATLVSRAGRGDVDRIIDETSDAADRNGREFAKVRLTFSLDLLIRRSEWIDQDRDRAARSADPRTANRYEAIVDELEQLRDLDGSR